MAVVNKRGPETTLIRRLELHQKEIKDVESQQLLRELKARLDSMQIGSSLHETVARTEAEKFKTLQGRLGWELTRWEDDLRVLRAKESLT